MFLASAKGKRAARDVNDIKARREQYVRRRAAAAGAADAAPGSSRIATLRRAVQ